MNDKDRTDYNVLMRAVDSMDTPVTTPVDAAIRILDGLYENGDLSVDQHAGIMRGFESLQAIIGAETPIGALTLAETWRAEKHAYMEQIAQMESAIEVVSRQRQAQD